MTHCTLHPRDPRQCPRIDVLVTERFPNAPRLIVQGAVCRPAWLVEIEGIAAVADDSPPPPTF
jgi:hypothetical protein